MVNEINTLNTLLSRASAFHGSAIRVLFLWSINHFVGHSYDCDSHLIAYLQYSSIYFISNAFTNCGKWKKTKSNRTNRSKIFPFFDVNLLFSNAEHF